MVNLDVAVTESPIELAEIEGADLALQGLAVSSGLLDLP